MVFLIASNNDKEFLVLDFECLWTEPRPQMRICHLSDHRGTNPGKMEVEEWKKYGVRGKFSMTEIARLVGRSRAF